MSCWFQTVGSKKDDSQEVWPAGRRQALQLHPSYPANKTTANKTFIFITSSLALRKTVSGEEEEGGGMTQRTFFRNHLLSFWSFNCHRWLLSPRKPPQVQEHMLSASSDLHMATGEKENPGPKLLRSHAEVISPAESICPHQCLGCPSNSDIFQEPDRHSLCLPQCWWQLCVPCHCQSFPRWDQRESPYLQLPSALPHGGLHAHWSHCVQVWTLSYQEPRTTDSENPRPQPQLLCFLMVNSMNYSFWITL